MALRQTLTALTIVLCAPLAGCASNVSDSGETSEPANKSGTAAMPCNLATGYAGDDMCILSPPSDVACPPFSTTTSAAQEGITPSWT